MNMVVIEIPIMTVIVTCNYNVNSGIVTATNRATNLHKIG